MKRLYISSAVVVIFVPHCHTPFIDLLADIFLEIAEDFLLDRVPDLKLEHFVVNTRKEAVRPDLNSALEKVE